MLPFVQRSSSPSTGAARDERLRRAGDGDGAQLVHSVRRRRSAPVARPTCSRRIARTSTCIGRAPGKMGSANPQRPAQWCVQPIGRRRRRQRWSVGTGPSCRGRTVPPSPGRSSCRSIQGSWEPTATPDEAVPLTSDSQTSLVAALHQRWCRRRPTARPSPEAGLSLRGERQCLTATGWARAAVEYCEYAPALRPQPK